MMKPLIASTLFFLSFSAAYTFVQDAYADAPLLPGEDSQCAPIIQQMGPAKLVDVQINPETDEAIAAYFEPQDKVHALVHIYRRANCKAAWREVKVVPMTRNDASPDDASTQKL